MSIRDIISRLETFHDNLPIEVSASMLIDLDHIIDYLYDTIERLEELRG